MTRRPNKVLLGECREKGHDRWKGCRPESHNERAGEYKQQLGKPEPAWRFVFIARPA
jgi:hypothetical protein